MTLKFRQKGHAFNDNCADMSHIPVQCSINVGDFLHAELLFLYELVLILFVLLYQWLIVPLVHWKFKECPQQQLQQKWLQK